jgi:hypothetical protein
MLCSPIYFIVERLEQEQMVPRRIFMRNISTIGLISAAAALSFLCAMATQSDDFDGTPPVESVASVH